MSTVLSAITNSKMKMRWEEPKVSEGLNTALAVLPAGIHYGFILSAAGGLTIRLAVDPSLGASQLVYRDSVDDLVVTLTETADVVLTLVTPSTMVYIGVSIDYTNGSPTTGDYIEYSEAEYLAGLTDVIIVAGPIVVPAVTLLDSQIGSGGVAFAFRSREGMRGSDPWGVGVVHNDMPDVGDLALVPGGLAVTGAVVGSLVAGDEAAQAIQFTNAGATGLGLAGVSGWIVANAGDYVQIDFRMDLAAVTATSTGVEVAWYDAAFALIGSLSYYGETSPAALTSAWADYAFGLRAPALAKYVRVTPQVDALATGGTVKIERLQVRSETARRGQEASPPMAGIGWLQALNFSLSTDLSKVVQLYHDAAGLVLRAVGSTVEAGKTWAIGTTATPFAVELDGTLEVDHTSGVGHVWVDGEFRGLDLEYGTPSGGPNAPSITKILLFDSGLNSWFTNTSNTIDDNIAASDQWQAINLKATEGWGVVLPPGFLPKGSILTTVVVGGEQAAYTIDLALYKASVTTGAWAVVAGTTALANGNATAIDEHTWSAVATAIAEDAEPYGFLITNNDGATRKFYYIRVTYTVGKLSDALGQTPAP